MRQVDRHELQRLIKNASKVLVWTKLSELRQVYLQVTKAALYDVLSSSIEDLEPDQDMDDELFEVEIGFDEELLIGRKVR